MVKLFISDKVYINKSKIPNADRGVFARNEIKKGETIERCPIIEISKNDTAALKDSFLVTYFFYFGKNKEKIAVALGFGSIYNHSYKPNAKYEIKPNNKVIEFTAIGAINKDDEITFNYSNGPKEKKKPLWFKV